MKRLKRLTRRSGVGYIARNQYCDYDAVLTDAQLEAAYSQCVYKLGELEDFQEELGVDLFTLFKALKDGVWTKRLFYDSDWRRYHTFEEVNVIERKPITIKTICCSDWTFENQHKEFVFEVQGSLFYELRLRDYGKTWALTKEELENYN